MIGRLSNWLDQRTGYRKLIELLLIEHIPGGAKWRYVWGSTLAFVFLVQLITGLLLMTAYSPSDTTAWGSVYYIQYEMDFGWLIRGLHHFGSQTMVVLLALHMLQVVIAGAHLPPREINWWLGLALMGAVLGLSLTGYLLPWDQKGYWATQVATNIAGNMPVAGPMMQKLIVGGPSYGNQTLTRFFALHVGVLPALIVVLLIAHVAIFRRHGVTHPKNAKGEGWFWPDQAFRDLLVSLVIFGIMLGLVLYGHGHKLEQPAPAADSTSSSGDWWDRVAHAGRDGLGANLDAPADPATKEYPARPEWYFLALFQLLKYFEGPQEIIGTVVIPMGVGLLLFLLPLLGYGRLGTFGHVVGILVIVLLLTGVAVLTYQALAADSGSQDFQRSRAEADQLAQRSVQLAGQGIPADGAMNLLRRDPKTRGQELFGRHCAGCHNYRGSFESSKATASDLAGFGTQEWIEGLLKDPDSPQFFGNTKFKDQAMSKWVKKTRRGLNPEETANLDKEFNLIAQWLATHPRGEPPEEKDTSELALGYRAYETHCLECHTYKGTGGGNQQGPDFTGYGDAEWIRLMVMSPNHPLRYGWRNHNGMPAFRDLEGPAGEVNRLDMEEMRRLLLRQIMADDPQADLKKKQVEDATQVAPLSDLDRELIIRWMTGDYRAVFGGEPISGLTNH